MFVNSTTYKYVDIQLNVTRLHIDIYETWDDTLKT